MVSHLITKFFNMFRTIFDVIPCTDVFNYKICLSPLYIFSKLSLNKKLEAKNLHIQITLITTAYKSIVSTRRP